MNPYLPNYAQRLHAMEQGQALFPQTIQNLQTVQPQVQCFYVNSEQDIGQLQIQPNTVYICINKNAKEIYTRQWNNDGNIESATYKMSVGKQEEPELKTIMGKLDELILTMKGKNNEPDDTNVSATNDNGSVAKQPNDGNL